ncbi:MAG TPA: methyltransferase domain-containing protein [Gemmatimonadaceae bacterium]|nr:methyltransferase domain-containing protein [Gemmatimonadaceae bacterium]
MRTTGDAFGEFLLAHYRSGVPAAEIIERDDGYIHFGSEPGMYFESVDSWSRSERALIRLARGRVLDIGCGAGRHALHLQDLGLDVMAIDESPGAIKVCKLRGVTSARVLSITQLQRLKGRRFDTVLLLGNNFGLLGSPRRAKRILATLRELTSDDAVILAGTRDPYRTTDPDHFAYHRRNRARGRLAGQLRLRVRHRNVIGRWFDYLFVSSAEMTRVLKGTGWQVHRVLAKSSPNYFAVIGKGPCAASKMA